MHNAAESGFPDIVAEVLAAQICTHTAEHAADTAEDHDQNHADTGAGYDADIRDAAVIQTENTAIDDFCHQARLPQINIDFKYHKKGGKQRKMPVFFEMPEDQMKDSFPIQTVYYTIIHVLFCDCKKKMKKY